MTANNNRPTQAVRVNDRFVIIRSEHEPETVPNAAATYSGRREWIVTLHLQESNTPTAPVTRLSYRVAHATWMQALHAVKDMLVQLFGQRKDQLIVEMSVTRVPENSKEMT